MKRLAAIALIASALAHGTPDGPRYYYLGPWVLDTDAETQEQYWRAPEHTVGLVDLRGSNPNGVGFFSTDTPLVDRNYAAFGDDLTYTLVFHKPGVYGPDTQEITP